MLIKYVLVSIVFCFCLVTQAQSKYAKHFNNSYNNLVKNLSESSIPPGVVIASPSKSYPNYYYHWVRDAGLTMYEVIDLVGASNLVKEQDFLLKQIKNWIEIEKRNQSVGDLGEPIFTVDGRVYPNDWGRPQSDGPAIRALAMIKYASLLKTKEEILELYRPELPANSPIKKDLEYIAANWKKLSFDLWEEVSGFHFFTRMAQRAALIKGAQLADELGDCLAAKHYRQVSSEISLELLKHKDSRGYVVPTVYYIGDGKNKVSGLDISVILASLYFSLEDGFFTPEDQGIITTAEKLQQVFNQIYVINQNHSNLATAIGRYPEDVYNGVNSGEGSPWFLATSAMSEYYCRLSKIKKNKDFKQKSLKFLDRVIYHSGVDGEMSEQFNRDNGYQQGANNLTWSYASYIRAFKCL